MWGYRSKKVRLSSSLKCQSLLHMAMFRHKQKTAIKYSKTLTDHFSVRCHVITEMKFTTVLWMLIPCCCNDLSECCSENTKSSCLNTKVSLYLDFWLSYHRFVIFVCNFSFCPPVPSEWLALPPPCPACPPQLQAARVPAPITAETPSAASWPSHRSSNKWLSPTSRSPRYSWELTKSGRKQRSWHVKAAVKSTNNPF